MGTPKATLKNALAKRTVIVIGSSPGAHADVCPIFQRLRDHRMPRFVESQLAQVVLSKNFFIVFPPAPSRLKRLLN